MFTQYVETLQRLAAAGYRHGGTPPSIDAVRAALNGGPSAAFARAHSLQTRRATGAFFTGTKYANRMITRWQPTIGQHFTYLDPACGTGDLLLAVAQSLPVSDSLRATLQLWSERLSGFDINPHLVATTKARLVLLARMRTPNGWQCPLLDLSSLLQNILVADGLTASLPIPSRAIRVMMNPPYTLMRAPANCSWSTGNLSTAAAFVHRYVHSLSPGSELIALLPDVLRSGTRYSRWRDTLSSNAEILESQLLKRFSSTVDVDVFLLAVRVADNASHCVDWCQTMHHGPVIQDLFEVRVGPVVPHRHRETGPLCPYVTTCDLPIGAEVHRVPTERRFPGTLFPGPFLAVRRTSRPGEHRCRATLVAVSQLIAVENHLLVLMPRDGSLETCRRVLKHLNSGVTDDWLDQRIRCRHLTVSAVASIPVESRGEGHEPQP